jgi:hypothetical protein
MYYHEAEQRFRAAELRQAAERRRLVHEARHADGAEPRTEGRMVRGNAVTARLRSLIRHTAA